VRCEVELDEDALAAGPGAGDLADLLVPGCVRLSGGGPPLELAGLPYLTLRDLVGGLVEAARAEQRGDPTCSLRLGRSGRAPDARLTFDLEAGTLALDDAPAVAARPLALGGAVRDAVARLAGRLGAALAFPPGTQEPIRKIMEEVVAAAPVVEWRKRLAIVEQEHRRSFAPRFYGSCFRDGECACLHTRRKVSNRPLVVVYHASPIISVQRRCAGKASKTFHTMPG
jgi:hypothetical protein